MKRLILFAVVAMTLVATPVMAKEGLYIGAFALPTVDIYDESGSGYGFRAGFGFNRYIAVEGSYEIADVDLAGGGTADLTGMALDLKLNFPLTSLDSSNVMSLEPYIRLGYADYEVEVPGSEADSGNGGHFGVGIELYLFRELSVNAGWTRTVASFDTGDARIKVIDLGLNYHFR